MCILKLEYFNQGFFETSFRQRRILTKNSINQLLFHIVVFNLSRWKTGQPILGTVKALGYRRIEANVKSELHTITRTKGKLAVRVRLQLHVHRNKAYFPLQESCRMSIIIYHHYDITFMFNF